MKRTQARGETIMNYLTAIKYLISRFKEPQTEVEITKIVYRNLLPDYRWSMRREHIRTREDIRDYGLMFEKENDTDKRYAPPPTAEKLHVPACAPRCAPATSQKAAGVEVEPTSAVASSSTASTATTKRRTRKPGEERKTKWQPRSSSQQSSRRLLHAK